MVVLVFIMYLISRGYLLLGEDLIIMLASAFWLDGAGSMGKEIIDSELVSKGDSVKESYMFFLLLQKDTLRSLLGVHESRKDLGNRYLVGLRGFFVVKFLQNHLNSYLSGLNINFAYNKKKLIVSEGSIVLNELLKGKIEKIFNLILLGKNKDKNKKV